MYDDPFEKIDNKNDPFYLEGEIIGHTNPFLFVKIGIFILSVIVAISLCVTMPKVIAKMNVPKDLVIEGYSLYEDINVKEKDIFNAYKISDDHRLMKYMYAQNTCLVRYHGTWQYDSETKTLTINLSNYETYENYKWVYHAQTTTRVEHFKVINNDKIVANETDYNNTFVKVKELTYGY